MKKLKPWVNAEEMEIREFRKDRQKGLAYLNAAIDISFEENDPEFLLMALSTVAKAFGMTQVAKDADLRRESLHRMLSRKGNPEWNSLFRVFRALKVRPKLEPLPQLRRRNSR